MECVVALSSEGISSNPDNFLFLIQTAGQVIFVTLFNWLIDESTFIQLVICLTDLSSPQFWWNIPFDEMTFLFNWLWWVYTGQFFLFGQHGTILWDFYWDTSRICTNSLQSELDYVLDYLHAFLSTHLLHCCRGYFSVPCFLCASSCRVSCRVLSFLFVTASLAPPQISPDQAHKTKCGLICQKLSFDGYNYLLLIF